MNSYIDVVEYKGREILSKMVHSRRLPGSRDANDPNVVYRTKNRDYLRECERTRERERERAREREREREKKRDTFSCCSRVVNHPHRCHRRRHRHPH